MPRPVKGSGRYMAGLDGLRALAVLAVIAYHLNLQWVPGGLLGVGVFFVLSGYLITDLLVAQWDRRGRIDLRDFWYRRARRLLPALWTMLLLVLTWITLFKPHQLASLRGDVLAALLYASNWWYIFHHVSYFARYGPPSPFVHLWSLAVEEQFYLVWPLLLWFGLRFVRRKGWLVLLTLVLATASALAMALIYHPGLNPNRVYYGTDTRAFALLIGAALALVWPSQKLSTKVSPAARFMLDAAGVAGLVVVLWMFWQTNQYEPFLYRGGMVILSLATAAVVASLAHPASHFSKILGIGPLRWLGVRSYGLYLWHYPVIVLTTPTVNTSTSFDALRASLQVAASIALAALSWHFVEEPIRQGSLSRWWQDTRQRGWANLSVKAWTASLAALLALMISVGGLAGLAPAAAATFASIAPAPPTKTGSTTAKGSPTKSPTPPNPPGRPNSQAPVTPAVSGSRVTAIGDSVLLDAKPALQSLLPGTRVYGQVDRQLYQAQALVSRLKQRGALGNRVIIELGTNGAFTQGQLISLLRSLGSVKRIVLVNTRVPQPWQNVVNQTLAQVAKTFPRTVLVNWHQASAHHPGWFYPDGVHLNPAGAEHYAQLLVAALKKPLPAQTTEPTPSQPAGQGVTAIGDSVMLDAKPYLQRMLPGINVQGKVGRQLYKTPPLIAKLKQAGTLGNRVIIELGTNGSFTRSQLVSLLRSLGPVKRIVLVNTRVPQPWQNVVNQTLAQVAKTFPHTVLVNWYRDSANHNSWFYSDGVHLVPVGAQHYARFLVKALEEPLPSTR